ncbi:hypothetical protein L21TH_2118 [Caldisalinibacter kiritimatiensis]|uniref:Uncharacterized protein n=1 Tax=Caldisalinibacter kiritimatiensis TaxID=1304284 RepID=R1CSY5_9FIRM|nr:hypothetical protein L21TH_2118 [Caldisalinibacter kiritimatiensis]
MKEEKLQYTVKDGYLKVSISEDINEQQRKKVSVVLETMIVGIEALLEDYSEYLTLEYGEV